MSDAKQRLILALDVQDSAAALDLAERTKQHVGCFKIGLGLFVKCGPSIVKDIAGKGAVFLDLKLHDIPATMKAAAAAIRPGDVSMITVHAANSSEALKAAVQAAAPAKIIGVTVLTSLSQEDLEEMGVTRPLSGLAVSRALKAMESGCAGAVCSVHEAKEIRKACGKDFIIITPGIRPSWDRAGPGDQKRVATPAEAVRQGADMIVVGRAIRNSPDPAEAAERILKEIGG